MLFDQTLFSISLVAILLGISWIAKLRLGYSWSLSSSRRRS